MNVHMTLCRKSHQMAEAPHASFFSQHFHFIFPTFFVLHCNLHSFDGFKSQFSSTVSHFKGFRSLIMYARIQSKCKRNIKS